MLYIMSKLLLAIVYVNMILKSLCIVKFLVFCAKHPVIFFFLSIPLSIYNCFQIICLSVILYTHVLSQVVLSCLRYCNHTVIMFKNNPLNDHIVSNMYVGYVSMLYSFVCHNIIIHVISVNLDMSINCII